MIPDLFSIGPFTLHSFGLLVALGLIVAAYFLSIDLARRGRDAALAWELAVAAGVGGFLGARVDYLIQNGGEGGLFSSTGLVWWGGVIGGAIGVWVVAAWRKVPMGVVANAMAPALALGYAIGRIGCQLSGDGDYGSASSLPWAMSYPDGEVPTTEIVHPTPIYETTAMLVVFYALWRLRDRFDRPWALFGLWCVFAGIERFLIEFIRRNDPVAIGLTTAQLVSVGLVIVGGALLWLRSNRTRPEGSAPTTASPKVPSRGRAKGRPVRRAVALVAVTLLTAGLVACGGDESTTTSTPSPPTTTEGQRANPSPTTTTTTAEAAGRLESTSTCSTTTDTTTAGPFYVTDTARLKDGDLNADDLPGDPIRIAGYVYSGAGKDTPLAGAVVDIWQTDGEGRYWPQANGPASQYTEDELSLRGSVTADANGYYTFTTIYPGEYEGRARHIHIRATSADGNQDVTTQLIMSKPGDRFPASEDRIAQSLDDCHTMRFTMIDGIETAFFDFHG